MILHVKWLSVNWKKTFPHGLSKMSSQFPKALLHACGNNFSKMDKLPGGAAVVDHAKQRHKKNCLWPQQSPKHQCLNDSQIAKEVHASTISRRTISKLYNDIGLYACKHVKYILFTFERKCNQYREYREHGMCTDEQWSNILFTDERKFTFSSDSRCQYFWLNPALSLTLKILLQITIWKNDVS